ncbi:hypothetical protein GCM10022231_30690 [Gordonia caeni]|uniref:D-alanyl-D-alanine carboxypeptidase-like core domain-containing protein n=2 Tax=Gordonia caeni TaxID=1007097 RepID=A0ABP7PLG4_9ACTN
MLNTATTPATRRRLAVAAAGLCATAAVMVPAVTAPTAAAAPAGSRAQVLGIPLAPGTSGLKTELAVAYTVAARDARAAGVPLRINSGKRSRAEQAALWREGVATYGSPAAARRWVLPPSESTHVTGEAVDVGPRAGAAWLQRNGHRYGLCRTFDNEWWHFELSTFPGTACPPRVPDASVPRR